MSKREGVVRPRGEPRIEAVVHSDWKNAVRATFSPFCVLIPFLLAWTTACSDNTGVGRPSVDNLPNIAGLTISSPLRDAPNGARASAGGVSLDETLVYVSLVPGSVMTGLRATIRDMATGQSITADIVQGGFDPVAIPASVGDTLIVEITGISGDVSQAIRVVAKRRPPVVVRTDPPPKKRDVPLNSIVVIVFSEPIDPATLGTESVKLLRGGTLVPGTVQFADVANLRVEFHPVAPLAPETDYQLVLSPAIRSVNGVAFESFVTVPFSTITAVHYSIGGTVSGLEGLGLVLRLNNAESLPVPANGAITFASTIASGAAYSVTVIVLPSNPAQLCVVSGGEGTVASANVTDVAITCSVADPSLRGQILFTTRRDAASEILVLDLDQSTITRLTSAPDRYDSPQWSPDRTRIAFLRQSDTKALDGLWVMRADGSGAVRISAFEQLDRSYCWSPDGTKLAVFDHQLLKIVNADGSGEITLRESLVGTYIYLSPAWSPDGSTIAFFGDTPDSGLDWFFQVLVMDADGSNVRRLTSPNAYGGMIDPAERYPAWSPDGTKLTFWTAAYGLTVVNRDGTAAFSASHDDWRGPGGFLGLSVDGDATPDWSLDGRHLVFNMRGQLYVTLADGSGIPRQLTSVPGGAFHPAWLK